jgi:hypothetical protein
MTKTLNQISFLLHQNQNIIFSNIGNQNIFFRKKPYPPPWKLNGPSLIFWTRPLEKGETKKLDPPPIFSFFCVGFVDRCLSFCLFFFWPLCCLSFFDLRILITSLWYLQTLLPLKYIFDWSLLMLFIFIYESWSRKTISIFCTLRL